MTISIEFDDALRCITALLAAAARDPKVRIEYRMTARRMRASVLLAQAHAHLEASRP